MSGFGVQPIQNVVSKLYYNDFRRKVFLGSSPVFFSFDSVEKTGVINKINVYNNLFIKLRGDYYIPIFQLPQVMNNLNKIFRHKKRKEKLLKYYSDGVFENINSVNTPKKRPFWYYLFVACFVG